MYFNAIKMKGDLCMLAYLNHTKKLCKTISDMFDVSTFLVTPTGDIAFECLDNRILNPLYQNDKQKLFTLLDFDPKEKCDFPVIKKTYFYENYILISILKDNQFIGTVIIGPTVPYVLYEQKINGIINDFLGLANRKQVFNYYETIPVIPKEKLINLSVISFYMINHIILTAEDVEYENDLLKQISVKIEPTVLVTKSTDQLGPTHHNPLLEKQLVSIIRSGQVEELKKFTSLQKEKTGILSKSSYIRSSKNLTIVAIAIGTRAAIDGGLHSEIAFSLSDSYIQRLEDLYSIEDIESLQIEAMFTFTEKVRQVKDEQYSGTITRCKDFIYSHRHEKITHNDVANFVQLSHSYLSTLFKEEVGITISQYIQKIKIEEAKNLIAYTDTPLSEVSFLLYFTDQSYFTKVFKKFEGITPKQYKEKHHLI